MDKNAKMISNTSMEAFFQSSLLSALENQRVDAEPCTVEYVSNLLISFSRSENFFDNTDDGLMLKPLASFYAEAVEGETSRDRDRALKRLGDVALFVAGVLGDSLNRKPVDVDYYVSMGGSAYAVLADTKQGPYALRGFADVFNELSQKFTDFVDVLCEVTETANVASDKDVLRLYDVWSSTGSPRARRQLARLGLFPSHLSNTEH